MCSDKKIEPPAAQDGMNGFPCMFPIDMVEPYATVLAGLAMKTTLNLNDQVLRSAKGRAARDGITLTRFVHDGNRTREAPGALSCIPTSRATDRRESPPSKASWLNLPRLRPKPLTAGSRRACWRSTG